MYSRYIWYITVYILLPSLKLTVSRAPENCWLEELTFLLGRVTPSKMTWIFQKGSWWKFDSPTRLWSSLPETSMVPENWWLEYDSFPLRKAYFQGLLLLVSGRVVPPDFGAKTYTFMFIPDALSRDGNSLPTFTLKWLSMFHLSCR